ncbi:hypothetical protein LPUS_04674 [Lasallia pustulata]|uniref:Uncharacterized protein n=1 Tax=Lasallia pustulata TaxID=136370 RepID=A0A1W5CX16_9LECA|nr:hypothetical protein LPUS_04674 [Lasallia pustulata]
MKSTLVSSTFLLAAGALSQHNTSTANGCDDGYYPGTDTVIYTVPYTYQQVMSVIGDYQNLTWSGSPGDSVTLNGIDNTVGTARTYDISGAHVIETITEYSKPPNGPYVEVHVLAPLTLPSLNVSFYGDFDGTIVTPICNGAASTFNFTINFCGTNATVAAQALHQIHLTDAQTVGVFLGGQNFTSCAALNSSLGTPTMGASPAAATFTGAASTLGGSALLACAAALAAVTL